MSNIIEISQLPTTRQQANSLSQQLIEALQNGEINPLELKIMFKGIEEVISKVKPTLDEAALTEAQKYGAKNFTYSTAKLTITEAGARYDFSCCNHPAWMRAKQESESITNALKEIETTLKTVTKPFTVVDEETGEAMTVNPPVKKSTTTVAVSLI